MKKIKKDILLLAVLPLISLTGCNNTNDINNAKELTTTTPNLKTGILPNEIDYKTNENNILNTNNNIDYETISSNISLENYTTLQSDGIISSAGSYLLEGTYSSGITFNLKKNDEVHLFLNNTTINNDTGSAFIKSDKKINVIVTAIKDTVNTISTTSTSNVINIKGDLTINGEGTININNSSTDSNAIKVSKTIAIVDATVNINSYKNGITAESIYGTNAKLNITAKKDGLKSECDFDNSDGTTYDFTLDSGFTILNNCNYVASTNGDAIQADTYLYIKEGTYDITTNGEFVSYSSENKTTYDLTDDDYKYRLVDGKYVRIASDSNTRYYSRYALTQSSKGFKVGNISYDSNGDDEDDQEITDGNYGILIDSGTFTFNTSDDAIHTNTGSTYINNGTFTITSLDDAITSDYASIIENGNINILSSYEGIEGTYVYINNGNVSMSVTDDGINASNDSKTISPYIIISDGDISIDADGDSLDSNGTLVVNGGNIKLYGTTNNEDLLLDSDNGTFINGGNIIGVGKLGMEEYPVSNSNNITLYYFPSSTVNKDTKISIKDSSLNEIYSATTPSSDSLILMSSPNFKLNTTYYLYLNDNLEGSFKATSKVLVIGNNSSKHGENRPQGR